MLELPDNYTPQQAYNDMMYLGVRLKKLEDLVDNIWHILQNETVAQEAFTSLKMDTRLKELEDKQEGLMANYTEHLPSIQNAEKHIESSLQRHIYIYNTIKGEEAESKATPRSVKEESETIKIEPNNSATSPQHFRNTFATPEHPQRLQHSQHKIQAIQE